MLRIPKIINVICSSSNLRTLRHGNKISQCVQSNSLRCNLRFDVNYSTDLDADNVEKPRRKTMRIPKITLVHPDNSVTVTLLEEAQKLAKRRRLELVQVFNNSSKNDRDVYKLKTPIEEPHNQSQENVATKEHDTIKRKIKSTKLFILKHKIDESDLIIKMNNINKSLKKGYKVKIVHTNPDAGNDNILQGIKRKAEGCLVKETSQNGRTTLVYTLIEDHVNDSHESEKESN